MPATKGSSSGPRGLDAGGDLPAPNAKVWITGFAKSEHADLARLVERAGFVPTPFSAGAGAVLAPFPAPQAILDEAARTGRKVLAPAHFRQSEQARSRRSALEIDEESVRILDVSLPRRTPGTARPAADARFAHLCLDANFLTAARTVALGARARMPTALEGETAVSKTTAVTWVAWVCRQECVRLSLNGQTDTGELVGKFVPGTVAGGPAWNFWEGIIPAAMRLGHWVILDELNLAEPQVLERLNPVLEAHPTLVLSEHRGERYGIGGDVPLADDFRVFATMNGAEYAGRSVLSPAFRDRWTLWNILEPPGEADYRALLMRLVHGVQPAFVLGGVEWRAPDGAPVHPGLAAEPHIDDLLGSLAAFHAALATAAGGPAGHDLGRGRRERYAFTRRTLLAAMALVAERVAAGHALAAAAHDAIEIVYVQRVAPGPDRQAVRTTLRTVGLAA